MKKAGRLAVLKNMKQLSAKIASLGAFMALAAVISSVLSFIGYNLRVLRWIDMWGETTGWVIRGGLLVAGIALYFVFSKVSENPEEA